MKISSANRSPKLHARLGHALWNICNQPAIEANKKFNILTRRHGWEKLPKSI